MLYEEFENLVGAALPYEVYGSIERVYTRAAMDKKEFCAQFASRDSVELFEKICLYFIQENYNCLKWQDEARERALNEHSPLIFKHEYDRFFKYSMYPIKIKHTARQQKNIYSRIMKQLQR